MSETYRRTHMCMSIRGFLRHDDRYIRKQLSAFTKDDGSPYRSVRELRESLEIELLRGREKLPMEECDNFDSKKGCMGHELTKAEYLEVHA